MDLPGEPTVAMWLIIITSVVWLIVEAYVLYYKKETISHAVYKIAAKHPIIPFFIGTLIGHWFW